MYFNHIAYFVEPTLNKVLLLLLLQPKLLHLLLMSNDNCTNSNVTLLKFYCKWFTLLEGRLLTLSPVGDIFAKTKK